MVDVIIPAYNAHSTIGRTLASIAMQTIVNRISVTIVDDCSTDGGYEQFVSMFSPMMEVQEVKTGKNGGPGAARQLGLEETDGDFVTFIDADDTFIGSHALALLEREIIKSDMDLVMGDFMEELDNGSFVHHGENMVWMFGKMYRRNFLDRFLIRFNDTRANEDTGFNTLVQSLTRHVKHIPQSVYMWHHREDSITRVNNGVYAHDKGHQGYIENMIWAVTEMCDRNLNKEIIRGKVVSVMCILYFMHMGICYSKPLYADSSMEYIKEFYKLCYQPIEEYIPTVYLQETFIREQAGYADRLSNMIPIMTFKEFLAEVKKEDEA